MAGSIEFLSQGTITSAGGFTAGAAYGGINKHSRFNLDVGILVSGVPCEAAGVFTKNQIKSAPVLLCQRRLSSFASAATGSPQTGVRAVIVNSGCANASTGEQGMRDAADMAGIAAVKTCLKQEGILVASTGIIGRRLPLDLIRKAVDGIEFSADGGHAVARAIMTTDTLPKEFAVRAGGFTVGGIAKGAGMIHPNMATMLCFITSDAKVDRGFLSLALQSAVDGSFNMISVDGDTSPNDTVLILANGVSGQEAKAGSVNAGLFQEALDTVCVHLAKAVARDGEGATKLIEVTVRGARTLAEARDAARTIVSSNLVKTAIHGADPNWGRVIAAAGRSEAAVEEDRLVLSMSGILVLRRGAPVEFDSRKLSSLLKQNEVVIDLDLNFGKAVATAWGCDLSAEYVSINADYTT